MMPELAMQIEQLRAENVLLRDELETISRTNKLFLVLLCFIVSIAVSVVIALKQELLRMWRNYDDILMPHHNPPERALRMHDNFNLLVLPGVVFLDVKFVLGGNLDVDHNPNFWIFLWFTVGYIVIDMFWVAAFPQCVKSQATILVHHAVTLLYMGIPGFNPVTRYAMAVCLLVEINTWFLIMRRSSIAQHSMVRSVVSVLFHVTWYVIRIGVYPYMVYDVYMLFRQHVEDMKSRGDPAWERASYGLTYMVIPPIFQTLLTSLNFHWTIQLIKNSLRKKGPDKGL